MPAEQWSNAVQFYSKISGSTSAETCSGTIGVQYDTHTTTRIPCNSSPMLYWCNDVGNIGQCLNIQRPAPVLIARLMGPTWGPSGADRTQAGPMLAPWTLLSGNIYDLGIRFVQTMWHLLSSKTWSNKKLASGQECRFKKMSKVFCCLLCTKWVKACYLCIYFCFRWYSIATIQIYTSKRELFHEVSWNISIRLSISSF